MTETRDSIALWADETFGPATDGARIARALEELGEAARANQDDEVWEELADVAICLCACPAASGIDVAALVGSLLWSEIEAKMQVNRARKWIRRGDGCGDHVKDHAQ